MVWVPGGIFELGRELGTAGYFGDTTPVSLVTLTGFHIGKYQITQGQWHDVMGTWPSFLTGINDGNDATVTPAFNRNNLPITFDESDSF